MPRFRATSACARCYKRKKKCDGKHPACSGCVRAGVECVGIDREKVGEVPRSVVQFLEQSIASLEVEREHLRITEQPYAATNSYYASYASANLSKILNSNAYTFASELTKNAARCTSIPALQDSDTLFYKSTLFTSSELPSPVSLYYTQSINSSQTRAPATGDSTIVPLEVAKLLLDIYLERILPQYPFFLEDDVRFNFDRVYPTLPSSEPASDESVFIVSIILAISALTSKAKDFRKIASLGESLHRAALSRCSFLRNPRIRTIQCILLLVQLAMLLPYTGNLWHLIREAMNLAIQLGLHQEHSITNETNVVSVDLRRRIFWTVYGVERSIDVNSHRQFSIEDEYINVKFPSAYEDSCIRSDRIVRDGRRSKAQFLNYVRFRQMQSEIYAVQFLNRQFTLPSYELWVAEMKQRIVDWRSDVDATPDWFSFAFNQCFFMLYRPCPRNPLPSEEFMIECFKAAVIMSRGCWELSQTGYLQFPFHNLHNGFEAGVAILCTLRHHPDAIRTRYGNKTVAEILQQLSGLFILLSERWPAATYAGDLFDGLKKSAMKSFLSPGTAQLTQEDLQRLDLIDSIMLRKPVQPLHSGRQPGVTYFHSKANDPNHEVFHTEALVWSQESQPTANVFSSIEQPWEDIISMDIDFNNSDWLHMSGAGSFTKAANTHQIPMELDLLISPSISSAGTTLPCGIDLGKLQGGIELLPPCNHCRSRRVKCDRNFKSCYSCVKAQKECVYYDNIISQDVPRRYVYALQQKLKDLIREHSRCDEASISSSVNVAPHFDLDQAFTATLHSSTERFNVNLYTSAPVFFGPTSIYSQVVTMGMHSTYPQCISATHQGFESCLSTDLYNLLPLNVAVMPPEKFACILFDTFRNSIDVFYPVLGLKFFKDIFKKVYITSNNSPWEEQTVYLVFAVSAQLLSTHDPRMLSVSHQYFKKVVNDTEKIGGLLHLHQLSTLQTILLICIYLLLNPEAGDIWRAMGLASRLCLDLVIADHNEAEKSLYSTLYQITYGLDCIISISFGRPPQMPEKGGKYQNFISAQLSGYREKIPLHFHNIARQRSSIFRKYLASYNNNTLYESMNNIGSQDIERQLSDWKKACEYDIDLAIEDSRNPDFSPASFTILRSWVQYHYCETSLILHRTSASSLSPAQVHQLCANLIQSITDLDRDQLPSTENYLSNTTPKPFSLVYPVTWPMVHSLFSAGLTLVSSQQGDANLDSSLRQCITLLARLGGKNGSLAYGFSQALEDLSKL
ncbi:hypothetical protein B7463_g4066, partial [Scytalidium lignicola]